MATLKLDISDINHHKSAVEQLLAFAGTETVFLFDAEMGNGKTTFIKAICSYLGVTDTMSSPTYSIVNEYNSPNGKVFHFDLYRIKKLEELYDIGFEEYVTDKNHVFIEWPLFAMTFVDSYVEIKINIENNNRYLYAEIIKNHD
jgi:tRNA threonylcarbamoyladenosine biosynthesis protein TsaE